MSNEEYLNNGLERDSIKETESINNIEKKSILSPTNSIENTEIGISDEYNKDIIVPLKRTLREKIFLTLTEPTNSTFSYCLSFYFDGLVALSMVLMCAETVVAWSRTKQQQAVWRTLETIITANFMVDFLLKVATVDRLIDFVFKRPTFTIDLLGILPFFIEISVENFRKDDESSSIKALRVLRLLRFFRLSRIAYENFPDFRMFIHAVKRSKLAIAFLGMYVFGAGLFFASCVYYAETSECYLDGQDGIWYYSNEDQTKKDPCAIQNMFGAWWFTLVTMTTVGYGDTVVISPWGRILTVLIMIGSLIFLALPSAIFAANLTEMYLERRLIKKINHHHGNPTSTATTNLLSHESRPNSPLSFPKEAVQTFSNESEIENILTNIEAATDQINTSLSTLTTHLNFIQKQHQQFVNILSTSNKVNKRH